MTVTRFFGALITLWIPNEKCLPACREAFEFYCWLYQLKKIAFLPAQRPAEIAWRLKQIRKCIRKMPELTIIFFETLQQIESVLPGGLNNPSDVNLILEKRDRVKSLIDFLKGIEEPGVEVLRQMMLEHSIKAKESRSFNALKMYRNNNH